MSDSLPPQLHIFYIICPYVFKTRGLCIFLWERKRLVGLSLVRLSLAPLLKKPGMRDRETVQILTEVFDNFHHLIIGVCFQNAEASYWSLPAPAYQFQMNICRFICTVKHIFYLPAVPKSIAITRIRYSCCESTNSTLDVIKEFLCQN